MGGPRDFAWRPTDPATLIWAEALDGGDWNRTVPKRDKLMEQKAPFTAPPAELVCTTQRFTGFDWTEKPELALVNQEDQNRHWRHTDVVDLDRPHDALRPLFDLSYDDNYNDPGIPVTRVLPNGEVVARTDGNSMFFSNWRGSTPQGAHPFLDRRNLVSGSSQRLFRSSGKGNEYFLAFFGPDLQRFLTWHQSPADPPNAFLRTLGKPSASQDLDGGAIASTAAQLTHIADPTPQIRGIKKHLVKYKRADGLDRSINLYTPPGYKEGPRVPTILYAYPTDFANASQAGQVTGSDQTFTDLRQYQLLLLAGFAILDHTSFPIVGDRKKAYDSYLDQLVADAKAAIDEGVRLASLTHPEWA